jgi:Lipocalin-like domain
MKNLIFFCLMAITLFTTACKKEEMQQNDIVGKWTLKEYILNGATQNLNGGTVTIEYKKDKTYETYYNINGQSNTSRGTWSIPSENKVFSKQDGATQGSTDEILKLEYPLFAKAIFQFQSTSGGNTVRLNMEK